MRCPRCLNEDKEYFYKGSKGWYCRKCVRFSRILLQEELESFDYEIGTDVDEYRFAYELTDAQKKASDKCLAILQEKDVLLHCVCGAGKTEIAVASIASYLARGLKVAYAIPRKEVVIELSERFVSIFPKARVTPVYGGHHERLSGDLIVCTCHQLYRYFQTFDLLILDEADAFPLKGDEALFNIAINACKGKIIFSTATIDTGLAKILKGRDYESVELFVRPSGKPLPVPKLVYLDRYLTLFYLAYVLHKAQRSCIIFVEKRRDCRILYRLYSLFFPCTYVYSDLDKRRENIEAFRKGRYRFIFATTVLERGITIPGIDVIILDLKGSFDEGTIVQMLGRVGRGISNEGGKTLLIGKYGDREVNKAMSYLEMANSSL